MRKASAVVLLGCLIVAAALPYVNVFQNDWTHYDDYALTVQRTHLYTVSADTLKTIWSPGGNYVPLRDTVYMLNLATFGPRIAAFQVTNLAWHIIGVLALFAFVARQWGDEHVAFFAALCFAVHPLHVEPVAWVMGTKDVMCFAWSVLAALAYLRAMTAGGRTARWGALAAVCLVLALASKLAALGLPLVFAALELCDPAPGRAPWRRRFLRWLPFALLTALWFVWAFDPLRRGVADAFGGTQAVAEAPPPRALVAAATAQRKALYWPTIRAMVPVTWRYVGLWFWPRSLSAIYTVPLEESWLRPPVLAGALGLAGVLVAGGIQWRRGRRRGVFWLAWAVAFYLPVSNLLPVAALMNDRYVHLPSAAGAVLFGVAVEALARRVGARRRLVTAGALALILALAVRTVVRVVDWRSPRALWESAARVDPENVRIRISLAGLPLFEGRPADAVRELTALESVAPDDYRRLLLLGRAYMAAGRPGPAAATFARALERYPGDLDLLLGLGTAVGLQGRYADTRTIADGLLERGEASVPVYLMAGLAAAHLGDVDAAVQAFTAATARAPREPVVQREAAAALLDSVRPGAALPFAEAWYRLTPSSTSAITLVKAMHFADISHEDYEKRLRGLRVQWPDVAELRTAPGSLHGDQGESGHPEQP